MKKLILALSLSFAAMPLALTSNAHAQTVVLNGLGSSALFLEAGLGTSVSPVGAQCWWSGNNSTTIGNVVQATDTHGGQTVIDAGNAWVAWTMGTSGSCTAPASDAKIWAYLQTDSVVGNRCLFNTTTCTISYPSHTDNSPIPNITTGSGLLFPANDSTKVETPLPSSIYLALNNHTTAPVNYAGTDIRPEDAVFAVARAVVGCGTGIGSTQYLGLGYDPTSTNSNLNSVKSFFSSSVFHTTQFTLPSSGYTVVPVGATPVVVAVNGFSGVTNISSATLSQYLDGTFSYTGQASGAGATGSPVTVLIREPLSGTYNTMEYNVPNRTLADGSYLYQTSQDVGLRQPAAQQVCDPGTGAPNNPLNIATPSGGHRRRAIGTGQEVAEVLDTTNNGSNILGYSFWSKANFAPFAGSSTTHYLTVDGVDPLRTTSVSGNPIPTSATDLASVTLSSINATGTSSYPIWSLIRFVTATSAPVSDLTNLASGTKNFTVFGGTNPRPDFITSDNLAVVRSHFIPPAGTTQPSTAANGHVGNITGSFCTAAEAGGDVGGKIFTLSADSSFCLTNHNPNGETTSRR